MTDPDDIQSPSDTLNKLSTALSIVARGDPIVSLRSELDTRFRSIDTRFAAIDKATDLQHEDMVRVPTDIDKAVDALQSFLEAKLSQIDVRTEAVKGVISERLDGSVSLLNEKILSLSNITTQQFASINNTFAEKDKAVLVGLSAQKESAAAAQAASDAAISKMENNFTKLIEQGNNLLLEVRRNTELQMNEIKSRLDRGEGAHSGGRDVWGYVVGAIGILLTVGTLVVLILERMPAR
jgi:rhodanese-related sulfurtransferase